MPGRVPWERYSGEDIESVVATYIAKKYPDVVRIRPSQGDAGIDIMRKLDDGSLIVYQVKSFASNLTSNQKNQIKKSWDTLLQYIKENGLILSEWHLVLPIDPTLQNIAWLEELTNDSNIKTKWDGLVQIDAWAAEMPEVADYYFNNNSEARSDEIRNVLKAATLPDITSRDGFLSHIKNLEETISRKNPNYEFKFQILDMIPEIQYEVPNKSDLISTTYEELPDGRCLVTDVFAKHPLATIVDPIKMETVVFPKTDEQKAQLKDFFDFGLPLSDFPAAMAELGGASPFTEELKTEKGALSVFELNNHKNIEIDLELPNGKRLHFFENLNTSGSKGRFWSGLSASECIELQTRYYYETEIFDLEFKLLYSSLAGKNCSEIKREFQFIANCLNRPIRVLANAMDLGKGVFSREEFPRESIKKIADLAVALEIINTRSDKEIPFPDINCLSENKVDEIIQLAELIKTGWTVSNWNAFQFETENDRFDKDNNKTRLVYYVARVDVDISGAVYCCGLVNVVLIGKCVKKNDYFILEIDEDYGNQTIHFALLENDANWDKIGVIYATAPPSLEEWMSYIKDPLSLKTKLNN